MPGSERVEGRRMSPAKRAVAHLCLIPLSCVFILPFYWLVVTSLKPDNQIFSFPPNFVPSPVTFEHYVKAFTSVPFHLFAKNTAFLCLVSVIGTLWSCSFVAYGFSMLHWRGREALFYLLLGTMMLPGQVTMVPLFLIFKKLGWINTYLPLLVPTFMGTAFFIFLLRQFFLTIPRDLMDASRVDGCGELKIYARIVLPLSKPALATVALFTFMGTWNNFLGPLIYVVDQHKYPLALGLAMFQSQYGTKFGELMAASTVMILPVIVLFFFTQKTFIQGIKTTGSKG